MLWSDPVGNRLYERGALPPCLVKALLSNTERQAKIRELFKLGLVSQTAVGFGEQYRVVPLRALRDLHANPAGKRGLILNMVALDSLLKAGGIGETANREHRREPAHQFEQLGCAGHLVASRRRHSAMVDPT